MSSAMDKPLTVAMVLRALDGARDSVRDSYGDYVVVVEYDLFIEGLEREAGFIVKHDRKGGWA